jgi:tetratricopeptide (TPR) repeat protein
LALRKEQVVLIGAVAVLGLLVWRAQGKSGQKSPPVKKASAPELAHQNVPDPSLVLPAKRTIVPPGRDIFSEPKDTRPLPPLDLVQPPIVPLAALRPPPVPGPGVSLYGKFLRVRWQPVDAPDLFAEAAELSDAPVDVPPAATGSSPGGAPSKPPAGVAATPEQMAAQLSSRKKLYDWYRMGDYHFGQIRNNERYTLAKRPNEDLLFVEFNPDTGQPKFPGQPPAAIPRKNVNDFDFAKTVPNEIEIRRAKFQNPLTVPEYDEALAFAEWCLERRLETPRALAVAEEMFARAAALMTQDPGPHLGLARVAEAKFEFEKAFNEYKGLIEGNLKGNPLPLVSLAQLEARFRMHDTAEARLFDAERLGRSNWKVQEALGRFLLSRGRAQEAVAHLRTASQYEPQEPEAKRARSRLRTALGAALLATGDAAEGKSWIEKALQADPTDQEAQAALVSAHLVASHAGGTNGTAVAVAPEGDESQGFDLLLANGLALLSERTPASLTKAKDSFVAAAAADPMRAYLPWRSLSFLAETTNHPEEAWRFADLAHENDPTDPWTLYQRGRLAATRDDLDGARDSFRAALDRDISFVDALAWLGVLSHRQGDYASAERYFERALALDPSLVDVQALRGVNFLEMGAIKDAEDTFKKVLAIDQDQPTARNGLAWCYYWRGDATEAMQRFRELDDNRRSFPETDPHRVYANAQIARITDHLEKSAWSDHFEGRSMLGNHWQIQENNGPTIALHDGMVTIEGTFKTQGRARIWQGISAADFVSIEARITIHGDGDNKTNSRVGLFVARETQRQNESRIDSEVTVSKHFDPLKTTVQTRIMKQGEEEKEYTDVKGFEWKLGVPVLVRIERLGKEKETPTVRILFDGVPVLDGASIPTLGRTTNELRVGVFAEGQIGRTVRVDVDDVEIVRRGGTK